MTVVRNQALPELRDLRAALEIERKAGDALHGTIDQQAKLIVEGERQLKMAEDDHAFVVNECRKLQRDRSDLDSLCERSEAWLAVCEALPERMRFDGTGQECVLAAIKDLQNQAARLARIEWEIRK